MAPAPRPTVALIPLDDRPVTCRFPGQLARLAGWKPLLPPLTALGHFLRPGDSRLAAAWLERQARRVDAVLVTLEGLSFGGLIASREPRAERLNLKETISLLRRVKKELGSGPLFVASTIMRLSITGRSTAHLRWWSAIHRWSELWEPANAEEAAEKERLTHEIPRELLDDYVASRQIKHQYNLALLEQVAEGTIDHLLIFQEDCTPRGPHRIEQAELWERSRQLGVTDRVLVLPGADEGLMLLLVRAVLAGDPAPLVRVVYTDERRAGHIPAFEDRPVRETVQLQLAAAGAVLAQRNTRPHLALVVHPPVCDGADYLASIATQGQQATEPADLYANAGVDALQVVRRLFSEGHPVALADVAYANGADPTLAAGIVQDPSVPQLAAYAGWNTAANSIGTALAWGLIRVCRGGANTLHQALLAERLGHDWLYQMEVRPRLMQWVTRRGWDPWNLGSRSRHGAASRQLAKWLIPLWEHRVLAQLGTLRPVTCRLPWPRTFECALEAVPA